ncbi:hypothetical protein HNR42_003353 [Deinobacterium chartae]|uniref:Uncharacterized protein n=1 Tax=Deinobacterium chartae TaxID=521158 RepID=A0A841I3L0_9DEIO|nr:hypothetical protein [Deinobacterium chartae]MBB6099893.1 hypothetical protein [Deinobacterium chartae]
MEAERRGPLEPRLFILRVWCEKHTAGNAWRASVRSGDELERRHFASLEALLSYLEENLRPEVETAGVAARADEFPI